MNLTDVTTSSRTARTTSIRAAHTKRQANIIVAIPARNEAASITACLLALARQTCPPDATLLLVNNSDDRTCQNAMQLRRHLPYDLIVERCEFPPEAAGAGQARRVAMAMAADRAGPDGFLLTTDADGVVAPDWVQRNVAHLRRGIDAVCGRALLDPRDAHRIPAHLHDDDRRECHLIDLLDRMAWVMDPERHDPYPRHTEASGASLAVTVNALRDVSGIPAIPNGEDRAFVRALWLADRRIRHDTSVVVTVSGRLEGRAVGGMADTMRRRIARQDEFTDEQVEPAEDAWRRYRLRRWTRDAWLRSMADPGLARELGLPSSLLQEAIESRYFGAAWGILEAQSPTLVRRRVPFVALPDEIAAADILLGRFDREAAD